MSKKKFLSFFKKYWITVWLVAAVAILSGIVVFAKFAEGQNYVKRVIAAGSSDRVYFSSDYLKTNNPKYPKNLPYGTTDTTSTFEFYIYNYNYQKQSGYYEDTINYDLFASLTKNSGTNEYNLSNNDDSTTLANLLGNDTIYLYECTVNASNETVETQIGFLDKTHAVLEPIGQSLAPDEDLGKASKKYKIVMPTSLLDDDVYLKIVAVPNSAHTDLQTIGGFFFLKTNTVDLSTGWIGAFNDDTSVNPAQYDSFNYAITGSGTAKMVLTWDDNLLEPNKQEIKTLFGITLNGTENSIEIDLDSVNNGGRYDIEFYVKNDTARATINEFTWNEFKNKVTLSNVTT